MIRIGPKQPQHCSEFSRLRSQTERVWSSWRHRDDPIADFLKYIRERLDEAAAIAKAAEACAQAGNPEKGVTIMLDVEQLVYEVNTFLNAASLLNRCAGN